MQNFSVQNSKGINGARHFTRKQELRWKSRNFIACKARSFFCLEIAIGRFAFRFLKLNQKLSICFLPDAS